MISIFDATIIVGCFVVANFLYRITKSLYKLFLRPPKDLLKHGKWAVVTGATDGIGKAFALALAEKGLNIFLLSRTESKLLSTSEEIERLHGVKTKHLAIDFNDFSRIAVEKALGEVEDIGVLVNNVGIGYPYFMPLHDLREQRLSKLISMNASSVTVMTHLVLPGMVQRKRGCVVNVGSFSGIFPVPLLTVYAATKSYVERFSKALAEEHPNIKIQCQTPAYVATKMAKLENKVSLRIPTPQVYVKWATRWVGQEDSVANPYWVHSLMEFCLRCCPDWMVSSILMGNNRARNVQGMREMKEKGT